MIIRLDQELRRASDEAHTPPATGAEQVRARMRRLRARRRNRVLAALVALALVAGLLWWFNPHVRLGPEPEPAPTPKSWWQTAYVPGSTDINLTMPADEVARRCQLTGTEVVPDDDTLGPPTAGNVIQVFESKQYLPTPTPRRADDGSEWLDLNWDETRARPCYLGFETTGDGRQLTADLLSDESTDWKKVCGDSSGFPFDDTWHVAGTARHETSGNRLVALYDETGVLLACELDQDGTVAFLDGYTDPAGTGTLCPSPGSIGALTEFGKVKTFATLDFHAVHFVRDAKGQLSTATRMKVTLAGTTQSVQFPVRNGIVVANQTLTLPKPVRWSEAKPPQLVMETFDAAGKRLSQCTRPAV